MKRYLFDQTGALLVFELIILSAVLVVAGFAGYQYLKNAKVVNKATNPKPHVVAKASPSPSAAPSPAYFTISQWGVRAPYSGIDKLTYTLNSGEVLATVISGQLAAKYSGCATYGAGQIERMLPTAIASEVLATDSNQTIDQYAAQNPNLGLKKVGDYYYLFIHDSAACENNGSASDQNQANDVVKDLVANLEPLN